ncbi:MAG: hypothetical protein IT326_07910 [Anaerolineae bacterium]|nr:hypothetical protein [Anaerolineae bacterium]
MSDTLTLNPGVENLDDLHRKIDHLTELLEAQQRRQEEFDDLRRDMTPVMNQMVQLAINELDEIGSDFVLEDLLYLLKRLLRGTRRWITLIDQVESVMDLTEDLTPMGMQAFNELVQRLDEYERKGYFALLNGGMYVLERVSTEFGEDDVRALGDNIVTILTTVRNMTQPDIMALANNAVNAMRDEEPEAAAPSIWALARDFNDPKVRKGLARMLHMVRAVADQSDVQAP